MSTAWQPQHSTHTARPPQQHAALLLPAQVLDLDASALLTALDLGPALLAPSRANGFANMLEAMRRRTRMLVSELPRFPSLRITADALEPQGEWREDGQGAHGVLVCGNRVCRLQARERGLVEAMCKACNGAERSPG